MCMGWNGEFCPAAPCRSAPGVLHSVWQLQNQTEPSEACSPATSGAAPGLCRAPSLWGRGGQMARLQPHGVDCPSPRTGGR